MSMASNSSKVSHKPRFGFDHIIDIITEPELRRLELGQWAKCCIFRVPSHLLDANPEAYTPQLVSIGPMHHNNPKLKSMEKQKRLYFNFFRERLSETDPTLVEKLKKYYDEVLIGEQNNIRHCYSEEFDYSVEEFANIMILDAVFIMELFLRTRKGYDSSDDHMFARWQFVSLLSDLLLIENQLPITVLVKLYDSVVRASYMPTSFFNLACDCFVLFDPQGHELDRSSDMRLKDSQHFTDMIRYFYLPSDLKQQSSKPNRYHRSYSLLEKKSSPDVVRKRIAKKFKSSVNFDANPEGCSEVLNSSDVRKMIAKKFKSSVVGFDASREGCSEVLKSATKLNQAGVSFEKVEKRCWLDIKFQKHWLLDWFPFLSCIPYVKCFKARLIFPQLTVDCTTERLLRNLIAFEQQYYSEKAYISSYVRLLDYLININDDVNLLVEKQVIVHTLSSNTEMAELANSLCKNVHMSPEYYGELVKGLNAHYHNHWNRTMAKLNSVYFSDLWRGSATVVGLAVLFFTFFNFFETIFKQKK